MSTFELSEDVFNEVLHLAHQYHREAEKCRDAKAFLAGCVMIGASFEASLLSFVNCYPEEASKSTAAPRKKGKVKPLVEWSLANLLAVTKERNWLPSVLSTDDDWNDAKAQIGDYAELIREIRNLVHPARYAIEMPRKRITKKYLESVFEILDIANDYLLNQLYCSIQEAINRGELDDA